MARVKKLRASFSHLANFVTVYQQEVLPAEHVEEDFFTHIDEHK